MNELIISLVSGIVGGLIVLVFQKIWDRKEKRIEQNRSSIINPSKNRKRLPKDILLHLEPGISIEKSREILGVPDNIESCKLSEREDDSNSESLIVWIYFYDFKNAGLKLTSRDKLSIDSVSIFVKQDQQPKIEVFVNKFEQLGKALLGVTKLDQDISEYVKECYNLSTPREGLFGIKTYFGRFGNFMDYVFFCYGDSRTSHFVETPDVKTLIGQPIIGFCVSVSGFCPPISIYE